MTQEENVAAWQRENPKLAASCARASHKLAKVQHNFLGDMAAEIMDGDFDSEFAVIEFIDKYGQRFAQLNAITAALSQLGHPAGR